jgi:hypothetical protein
MNGTRSTRSVLDQSWLWRIQVRPVHTPVKLLFIPLLLVLAACQTDRCLSERERIAQRNPVLERQWVALHPTSLHAEEERIADRVRTRQSLIRAVTQRFTSATNVTTYLAGVEERSRQTDVDHRVLLARVRALWQDGDHVWSYSLRDGSFDEHGWLVTRDGHIRGRVPYARGESADE